MNYYRRYIGDYVRDTSHLSLVEHGVYTVLLDIVYATEKSLPNSIKIVNKMCRATSPKERRAVDSILSEFFPVVADGGRQNPRAESEIARGLAAADAMREAGKRGASKRWGTLSPTPKGTLPEDDGGPYRVAMDPPSSNPKRKRSPYPSGTPPNEPESENPAPPEASTASPLGSAATGTDVESETPDPSLKTKSKSTRGTRLPESWTPDDDLRQWSLQHEAAHIGDYTGISLDDEIEKFGDHFRELPGARGLKITWAGTWRNWWKKAPEMKGVSGNGKARSKYETPHDRIHRLNAVGDDLRDDSGPTNRDLEAFLAPDE